MVRVILNVSLIWRNSIIYIFDADVLLKYIFGSLNKIIMKICEDLLIGIISQLSKKFDGYWIGVDIVIVAFT